MAAGISNFTAPHAGRQLRADLGYLPAIWAEAEDYVLVDDAEYAQRACSRLMHRKFDRFVEAQHLGRLEIDEVNPWGWDLAIRAYLLRHGVNEAVLPDELLVNRVRETSHRRIAQSVLASLQQEGTTGVAHEVKDLESVTRLIEKYEKVVLKAPWSSSGRGVRFVDGGLADNLRRWTERLIEQQGSVMVEPQYRKVKDFGMEFEIGSDGKARYLGLSLFHTKNGAYVGSVIADEAQKEEMMSAYVKPSLMEQVRDGICEQLTRLCGDWMRGPMGVDMMVVARDDKEGFLLHPCVEINLRRTMGHVAIDLARQCPTGRVMNIEYMDNRYKLRVYGL